MDNEKAHAASCARHLLVRSRAERGCFPSSHVSLTSSHHITTLVSGVASIIPRHSAVSSALPLHSSSFLALAMASACRDVLAKPADSRLPLYQSLLSSLVEAKDAISLLAVASHLLTKEGSDQYGRTYTTPPALLHLLHLLADPSASNADPISVEDMIPLLQALADLLRPRHDDYPHPLCECVDLLSRCHQAMDDYKAAAYALASFKWDDVVKKSGGGGGGGVEWMRVERRVDWYVRTAQFFLEENETGSASQQIKRAHAIVNELPKHSNTDTADTADTTSSSSSSSSSLVPPVPLLILSFKTCYARVLDSERRFLEAAQRYLELSHSPPSLVSSADALTSLQHAVTCAILAKPSPSRTRILSLLYQDERTPHLPHQLLLSTVYRGRVAPHSQVLAFESMLQEHQKAETSAGMTVVRASLMEHNISAMSRRYRNVGVKEMSEVLGVGLQDCERVVEEMIQQGRLKAKIDQVDGMLEFEEDTAGGGGGGGGAGGGVGGGMVAPGGGAVGGAAGVPGASAIAGGASSEGVGRGVESLLRWDESIEAVCLQVNRIVDAIQSRYPTYVL